MINVYPKPNEVIYLGQQGDNRIKCVKFDKDLFEGAENYLIPGGYVVTAKRSMDAEPYVCAEVTETDDYISWIVNAGDTGYEGMGSVQVAYMVDGTIYRSITWQTKVYPSLLGVKDPPDVIELWQETTAARLSALEARGEGSGSGGDVDLNDIYEEVGTPIPADSDLGPNYYLPGVYYAASDAIAASLLHCPTAKAFKMLVYNVKDTQSRVRILLPYTSSASGKIFIDSCDGNWGGMSLDTAYGDLSKTGSYEDAEVLENAIATGTNETVGMFVLQPGTYMITVSMIFEPNATGYRMVGLATQSGIAPDHDHCIDLRPAITAQDVPTHCIFSVPFFVDNAMSVYINAYQNSGGSLDVELAATAIRIC